MRALDVVRLPRRASVSDAQAADFQAQGFEIALHLWVSGDPAGKASGDGNCHNFPSPAALASDLDSQLAALPRDLPERSPRR